MSATVVRGFFLVLTVGITYAVRHHIFFWDTVQLASRHAHFYYDTNITTLLLPTAIDSGHPPTFGFYLAILWKLFGKSLVVSHFAMLPFLWGIVEASYRLGRYYLGEAKAVWLLVLFFCDPVLLGQSVLVSPDLVLICAMLWTWYGWTRTYSTRSTQWIVVVGTLVLAAISLRGMMIVFAFYSFGALRFLLMGEYRIRPHLKWFAHFAPAGVMGLAFLLWHHLQVGWIGHHADSTWAPSFARVDALGVIKNTAILGWRWLDFGRIWLWIVLIVLIVTQWQKSISTIVWRKSPTGELVLILVILTLVLSPSTLLYAGLAQHRYWLPAFLVFTVLVLRLIWVARLQWVAPRWGTILVAIGLLTGNLWIYPRTIAQGWDSTLAHLPYYQLRDELIHDFRAQNVSLSEVGTAFPNLATEEILALSGDTVHMVPYDLNHQQHIFYSNVMNDFSDEALQTLFSEWSIVRRYQKAGVECIWFWKSDRSARQ